VSAIASLQGSEDLALGNIIGSNIANIGLVLGLTALIVPLTIDKQRFFDESPSLIIASLIIVIFSWNNFLSRTEGFIMISLLIVYLWRALRSKEITDASLEDINFFSKYKRTSFQIGLVIMGIAMLVIGANCMVEGATNIARNLGVSEWLIGISIVALGTSLPELTSSLIAAKKGHGEMAIGNIFGSNIFNILMVLGLTATLHPLHITEPIQPDLTIAASITLLLVAMIAFGNHSLGKLKGTILLLAYCSYIGLKGTGIL
jgi:cation:H+ antiporter